MLYFNLWEVRQLDDLGQELEDDQLWLSVHNAKPVGPYLESSCDHGLTGNDGCQYGDHQAWVEHSWWNGLEKRVGIGTLIRADVCRLADVLNTYK